MKLKKISLEGYKSIITKQELNLNNNLIAVLGKNGVGKTNLLEAIECAFLSNTRYIPNYLYDDLKFDLTFELGKQEIKNINESTENTVANKQLTVNYEHLSHNIVPKRIKSKFLAKELSSKIGKASSILEDIEKELNEYDNSIKECVNLISPQYFNIEYKDITNATGHKYNINIIKDYIETALNSIEGLSDELKIEEDEFAWIYENSIRRSIDNIQRAIGVISSREFSLKVYKQELSSFQKEVITIDYEKIENVVSKLNTKTKPLIERMNNLVSQIEAFAVDTLSIIDNKEEAINEEKTKVINLLRAIKKAKYNRVYFLKNAIGSLFFKAEDEYRNWDLQPNKIMILAYFNYKNIEIDPKNIQLDKKQLKDFEKMLNENLPQFLANDVCNVQIVINNDNIINIMLEDKTGAVIDLNHLNAGIRWYYTYYFIKNCLRKGDLFLIDEPASFLHPDAQVEIYNDLKKLSLKGIQVIYTTHSPYMIPTDIKSIRFLDKQQKGTIINELSASQEYVDKARETIGISNINDILLKLSKRIVLVEGKQDEACLKAFMRIFNISETNYEIYPCYGHPVITMGYNLLKMGVKNFVVLADGDTKDKPAEFRKKYKDFMPNLNSLEKEQKIIYIADDKKSTIETLFDEIDHNKVMNMDKGHKKIDIKKVSVIKADNLSDKTKRNIKDLLKRLQII